MKQWHCQIGGRQYGPVGEEEIKTWISQGRLGALDLVWSDGMAEWQPASSIPEFAPALAAAPAVSPAPPAGLGAYSHLKPHRGAAVLVLGILGIVGCMFCGIAGLVCGIIAWAMGNRDIREIDAGIMDPTGRGLTQAGRICGMIGTILGIIMGVFTIVYIIGMIAIFISVEGGGF